MQPVAASSFFTPDHILRAGLDAPAELTEQAILCLELVAELSRAELSYQFKGGNSLLVILQDPKRFSIDVDIATDEPRERIEAVLDRIVAEFSVFTRWTKRSHKTKPWLPIASYHLFYRSSVVESGDTSIMLDVQLRRSPYKTEHKLVECAKVYRAEQTTEVPFPASIIGDKLLTLGPRTLGIPVGKNKAAQRLKHVFDVSTLLGTRPRLADIRESFRGCLEHENDLQQTSIAVPDILSDTLSFCGTVVSFEQKPREEEGMTEELQENIQGHLPFSRHLLSKEYPWERLQIDMARAALCITAVCLDSVDDESFQMSLEEGTWANPGFPGAAYPGLKNNPQAACCWASVSSWYGRDPLADS